jgi:hypothetical protein
VYFEYSPPDNSLPNKMLFSFAFLPREEILDIVKNLQVKILIFFNGGTLQRPRIYGGWKQKSCDVFLT